MFKSRYDFYFFRFPKEKQKELKASALIQPARVSDEEPDQN